MSNLPPIIQVQGEGIAFRANISSAPKLNSYHPSLTAWSDREWYVSFDLGATTESLDYHTRAVRSLDAGHSWTDEGPLLVKPDSPPTTHTIRTRRLSGHRIIGFGKWENREGFEKQRSNRETLGQVPMRLFWIESQDGGRSWSVPRWVEPPLVGPTWELCHPIIELSNKNWAAPVATWRGWNGELPNGEQTGLLISDDAGTTWSHFTTSFDGRGDGLIHWEQSVVVRRSKGLLATAWVFDPRRGETRPSVFASSNDNGYSFGASCATGFLAQTCKIIELRSEKILAAYRRHDRPGLWIEIAAVEGGEWRTERRGLLWAGSKSGMEGKASSSEELNALRFGYPSMVELDNGNVLLAYWRADGDQTAIHWTRFEPDSIPSVSG
jgi:hypothetical protein